MAIHLSVQNTLAFWEFRQNILYAQHTIEENDIFSVRLSSLIPN